MRQEDGFVRYQAICRKTALKSEAVQSRRGGILLLQKEEQGALARLCSSPGDRFSPYRPPKKHKKTTGHSDRFVLADKTNCTGGVYRARTYDLHDVNVAL